MKEIDYSHYLAAVDAIRSSIDFQPEIGLVLGSGLGGLADEVENPIILPYQSLPNWPVSTVSGHKGRLVLGTLYGRKVLVQQGRVHFYEGYAPADLAFAVRVMFLLGIKKLIVTNAAGGINPYFKAGDVMLISDHIGFPAMVGFNPLAGLNDERFGVRFPDMSQAYDRAYAVKVREIAERKNIPLQSGTYVWLSGPTFETPAEIRFLHSIGADAVGMSTVPEVIAARHAGMRVIGFSGITNACSHDGEAKTTHEEVLETADMIGPKIIAILKDLLPQMD